MRPVLLAAPLTLALLGLANPARGEPDPFVVRVTRDAPVFQSAAEGAPQVGTALAGQVYVHLPEEGPQGARRRIRFTNDLGWVERAALERLPGHELYAVAVVPALQVSALGILDNGALVAPIRHLPDLSLTLIAYGGNWVWIPRGTLRGPVDLTRSRATPAGAASGRASARAEDRTVGSAPAGFTPSDLVEAAPDSDEGEGEAVGSSQPLETSEAAEPTAGRAPAAAANVAEPTGDLGQPGAGRVIYGGRTVSSAAARGFLQRLADFTGRTVRVTSGDRNYVPRGGSQTSLHLRHRAADFVVEGQTLGQTFELIRANRTLLFAGGSYELIWHQPGTNTSGPHLHVGDYGDGRGSVFKTESRGNYRRVP